MNNKYSNEISKEFELFLDEIENYHSISVRNDRNSDIILTGLEVFTKIEGVKCASLFILNDNTFEFEHRASFPNLEPDLIENTFLELINDDAIGTVLQSSKINIHPIKFEKFDCEDVIIVPLVASAGVLGLALLFSTSLAEFISSPLLRLIKIQGNLFSSNLEKYFQGIRLHNIKIDLEQKVATRTMDLAQSKREFKAILDSMQTGILLVENVSNKITRANPIALNMMKIGENKLSEFPSTHYLTDISELNQEAGKNFEHYLLNANDEQIPVIRNVSYIHIGISKFRIESFVDITERKNVELALKNTNEVLELKVNERTKDLEILISKLKNEVIERQQAEIEAKRMLEKEIELNEMKTQFVSMVSHEFRTPLTVIRSAAQLVEMYMSDLSDLEKRDYLGRIVSTVDYMTELVENVIFIGHAEANNFVTHLNYFNLVEFCKNIITDFKSIILQDRNIKLIYESTEMIINSDENLLKLILNNLLSNAVKYSEPSKNIEVILRSNEKFLMLEVKDFGVGISVSEQLKISESFSNSKNNIGSITSVGLGMAVVNQALKMLDGSFELYSEIGLGSSFIMKFPKS